MGARYHTSAHTRDTRTRIQCQREPAHLSGFLRVSLGISFLDGPPPETVRGAENNSARRPARPPSKKFEGSHGRRHDVL